MASESDKLRLTLSQEQRQQIADHILSKVGPNGLRCPVCGSKSFTVGEHVGAELTVGQGASMHLGGPITPSVHVLCDNCFHILSFAAIPVGILKADTDG